MFGSWGRLRYSLKPRDYFISMMLGVPPQGCPMQPSTVQDGVGLQQGSREKQYFRDKAGFLPALQMTSLL